MPQVVPPSPRNAARIPRWAWIGLALVLGFDVWLRGYTFGPSIAERTGVDLYPWTSALPTASPDDRGRSEPIDCDEAVYVYVGRRIGRGDVLYRDLTDTKPPMGYWLYAAAVAIGGDDEWTVRVLPIPIVLATLATVWWIGLQVGGPSTAVLAAGLAAILGTDPFLFGNGSNLEHPLNLASIAALALLVHAWPIPGGRRWAIAGSGAAAGLALLFKQVAILDVALFAAAMLVRRGSPIRSRVVDLAWLGSGFAAVLGLAGAALAAQGALMAAYEDVVLYGRALATDTSPDSAKAPPAIVRWIAGNSDAEGRLPWPFGRVQPFSAWWGTGTWPLWLAAVPGLAALSFGKASDGPRRLVAAWTLAAWIEVAMPGLYWPHYYLLPTPGIALAVAWLATDAAAGARRAWVARRSWEAMGRSLVFVAAVTAIGWTIRIQIRDHLGVAPTELTRRYKGGGQWVALRELGHDLERRSKVWADPHLFVWGWQSPLFVHSGLDGVSKHFFADNLIKQHARGNHPLIRPRVARIMDDLRTKRPEIVFAGDPPTPAMLDWLEAGYLPSGLLPRMPDGRGLWVERDGYARFEAAGRAGSRIAR